jgi:hypothetical protein
VQRPLDHYISEIQHPDGKDPKEFSKRIESMLLSPIEVTDKLWHANLSCGPIGTSGAIPDSMNGIKEFEKETILAFRIHHSLCDGVSIAAAVGDLADEAAQLQLNIMEELKLSEKRYQGYFFAVSFLTAFLSILWFLVACFYSILLQVWKMVSSGRNPFDPVIALSNGPAKRSVDWKPIASIEEMKKVAKSISRKTTINDIACAMVSYAVQKQLEEHSKTHGGKVSIPQKVNITVPVHLTGGILRPGENLGNKIGGFVCTIPINGQKSARDRLRTISRILRREKLLPSPMISWNLARFFTNYLPIHFSKWALRQFSANSCAVVSNVRGFPFPIHWLGRQVKFICAFLPLPPGVPIGCVISSYAGGMSFGLNCDGRVVPNPELFSAWMLEEYTRIREDL